MVVSSSDDHGEWPKDGGYRLVFKHPDPVVEGWLKQDGWFWGKCGWQGGPVRAEITLPSDLKRDLQGKRVLYVARERTFRLASWRHCRGGTSHWDGMVLIVGSVKVLVRFIAFTACLLSQPATTAMCLLAA